MAAFKTRQRLFTDCNSLWQFHVSNPNRSSFHLFSLSFSQALRSFSGFRAALTTLPSNPRGEPLAWSSSSPSWSCTPSVPLRSSGSSPFTPTGASRARTPFAPRPCQGTSGWTPSVWAWPTPLASCAGREVWTQPGHWDQPSSAGTPRDSINTGCFGWDQCLVRYLKKNQNRLYPSKRFNILVFPYHLVFAK